MQRMLIIAGGTGGHIFPALVIAETLKRNGVAIDWMGTEVGMERRLVGDRFPMHFLPVKALRGKSIMTKVLSPFRLMRAVYLACRLIKKINPDVVLGMGGYASGPGGIAAWLLRKPLVIHEQNAKAGLTNRLLSRFAKVVLQAFPNAFPKNVQVITVGNPIRSSITQVTAHTPSEKPWRILVLGGSQGALAINQLISDWLSITRHREDFLIWHQTGQKAFEAIQQGYLTWPQCVYRVGPFIENMSEAYAWADIVISRSGALTVSELAAVGLPSILVPYPHAVDDHQYANALFLVEAKAAVVFRETELTPQKLSECLDNLLSSPQQLQQMGLRAKQCAKPNAVMNIIAACERAGAKAC